MPRDAKLLLILPAIAACVAVWTWAGVRWFHRRPVLPFEPRRPVPWHGIDVLTMAMAYYVIPQLFMAAATAGLDLPTTAGQPLTEDASVDKSHVVQRVLSEEGPTAWPIVLGVMMAIVVAPITEELVFRLLLQGWLESVERRMRRQMPWLRRIVRGLLPVAMVAVLFAVVHLRPTGPRRDLFTIVAQLQLVAVTSLTIVALLVCWLKYAAGATLADFGIVPSKLAGDVRLGLLAFLAVTPPIYAIFFAANRLLPEDSVADPIPMLFFGLVLGVLYFRTHRIVPSIVTHAAFNAVGVLWALAAS
jgi:membrane protease YdiL (CAAX protease family)